MRMEFVTIFPSLNLCSYLGPHFARTSTPPLGETLPYFVDILMRDYNWSPDSSSSFTELASESFLSRVEACLYACIIASCSCLSAALCSWARCLSDAILCDLRSSPCSLGGSTFILSSITFAFLCMPSSHGAELDVKWGGRGRECRTIAP